MNNTTTFLSSKVAVGEWELASRQLRLEFEAPVGMLDSKTHHWEVCPSEIDLPSPESALEFALASGVFNTWQVAMWRPGGELAPMWLLMPLKLGTESEILALVGFAGSRFNECPGLGSYCPESGIRVWGQTVADRWGGKKLPEPLKAPLGGADYQLIARLVRKVRVSDLPERFQSVAAYAIHATLKFWGVAWVPTAIEEKVITAGTDRLETQLWRRLAAKSNGNVVSLAHRDDPNKESPSRWFLAVSNDDQTPTGKLVVVDSVQRRHPNPTEMAMLKAVASMIVTQRHNFTTYSDLKELVFGVICALTAAIDAKDPYTKGHSDRVARIAARIGQELGMNSSQKFDLYLMGLLHDVGKIGVEDSVLKKAGSLTHEERKMIESHVQTGVNILSEMKKLNHLLPGVAGHHEKLDGTGYPAGLRGDEIPLEARILAVADSLDAMTSNRPYRRPLSHSEIEEIFRKGTGLQWDPVIVKAMFACRGDLEEIANKGRNLQSIFEAVNNTVDR